MQSLVRGIDRTRSKHGSVYNAVYVPRASFCPLTAQYTCNAPEGHRTYVVSQSQTFPLVIKAGESTLQSHAEASYVCSGLSLVRRLCASQETRNAWSSLHAVGSSQLSLALSSPIQPLNSPSESSAGSTHSFVALTFQPFILSSADSTSLFNFRFRFETTSMSRGSVTVLPHAAVFRRYSMRLSSFAANKH